MLNWGRVYGLVILYLLWSSVATATVFYVSKSGNNANNGLSWATAKASINGAVQGASHGDDIWVAEGLYVHVSPMELNKRVAIYGGFQGNETARNQRDWRRRQSVIKNAASNAFTAIPGTSLETLLDGLVIAGHVSTHDWESGAVNISGETWAGGPRAGLTIRNCLFTENTLGIRIRRNVDLIVENCRFIDCSQAFLYSVVFQDRPADNIVVVRSSLFAFCTGARLIDGLNRVLNIGSLSLLNNTIVANTMSGSLINVRSWDTLLIANNILAFNDADYGIYKHPESAPPPVIRNNCLYETSRSAPYGGALANQTGTNGNIAVDPKLVYRADTYEASNFRLTAASPCRNTGSNTGVDWALDLDGRNRILDTTVDMGAYERGSGPIYVKPGGNDRNSGATWALAKATPQAALDIAADNEIWVAAGTYANTNVQFPVGPSLYGGFTGTETARGQRNSGANETILDGGGEGTVVTFRLGVGETSVLDGFWIRNGGLSGIRMPSGSSSVFTSPTIRNNRITGNRALNGGGIHVARYCAPLVENNLIANNIAQTGTTPARGAGIYADVIGLPEGREARIIGNEIRNNTCSSGSEGGGIWMQGQQITVSGNRIEKNSADLGGAIWMSAGTVRNNRIVDNIALMHGGAIFNSTLVPGTAPTGSLIGNVISGNRAAGHGGGLAIWPSGGVTGSPTILGNTIVYNTAGLDGGAIAQRTAIGAAQPPGADAQVLLQYCIVAHNSSGVQANLSQGLGHVQYNCFYDNGVYHILGAYDPINAPNPGLGSAGNFIAAPGFVWEGEWRVRSDSPCVNVGDAPSGTDIDGQPRTIGASRDIGADEVLVVYVRTDGSDTNTGLSWAQAKQTLQAGIDRVAPGGEVWVSQGVYVENIALPDGVQVYGGFTGVESSLGQRNFRVNPTVLDGNGNTVVSVAQGAGPSARVDGFTIQNGNAQYGGGIACVGASPVIAHCIIRDNNAVYGGGASLREGSHASFVSTVFYQNTVGNFGSALYCEGSDPSLLNCTVAGHLSVGNGALYFVNASPLIANSIVANNAAGVTHVSGGVPTLRYNCVYGNAAFEYNGISSPTGTFGNISQNPVLTDGWRINSTSPCRDAGQNTFVPDHVLDIDGQPRIQGEWVDMGADECVVVFVQPEGNDDHDGSSWATAKATVQAGVNTAAPGGEVWVKQGTYSGTVVIPEGVALYGGFVGNEGRRVLRKWRTNETILHGTGMDNVVRFAEGATARSRIDGFTIRNGGGSFGAGIRCDKASPVIINNLIRDNASPSGGGGIGLLDGSNAEILNNFILENSAGNEGGGIAVQMSRPLLANNVIARNTAVSGSAIHLFDADSTWCINNSVVGNTSTGAGPEAVVVWDCAGVLFMNNVVALNSAGIRKDGTGTITFVANCAYNTPGVNYTGQADPTGSLGNITADPLLVNAVAGDYHLRSDSPCRNAGNNDHVQPGWVDMDGQPRIIGSQVDIGADELPSFFHVSTDGNDANSGLTWGAAKKTIQAAINAAVSGDQVWVKGGFYSERITLKSGVALYGGFAGAEINLDQRDISVNLTLLSGGGGGTVVTIAPNASAGTRIDGFSIVQGSAANGGGILCGDTSSPTIANNDISGNSATGMGGGIFVDTNATPVILNNTIRNNTADTGGGVMFNLASGGVLANNVMRLNSAQQFGGGVYMLSANVAMINNTLLENAAVSGGSALLTLAAPAVVANNLIAFNTASAAMRLDGVVKPTLRHNCVYNPAVANYNGIPDPTGSNGNISVDPLLAAVADWHLRSDSPCKDAGNDGDVQSAWVDIDRQSRIADDAVDIGADEVYIVRVKPGGDDVNSGDAWNTAKATIQAAIDAVTPHGEVWAAGGTYYENIQIKKGVALYGGFAAVEGTLDARDWSANVTVVDGDRRNSSVRFSLATRAARLDGFTVRNGAAELGGGVYIGSGSPTIANCILRDNTALGGGGLAVRYADPLIYNTVIADNQAVQGGGAYIFFTGDTSILNSTIAHNTALDEAGGVYCTNNAHPDIHNTVIAGHDDGGIFADETSNPVMSYNCLNNKPYDYDGVMPGAGDITGAPTFVSAPWGDYRPAAQSVVIDAGSNSRVPQGVAKDVAGRARIADGNGDAVAQVDIGAYERVAGSDIQCTLLPEAVNAAGALWRLTTGPDTNWRESGRHLGELPPGTYTVQYNEVPGWMTPASQNVTAGSNQTQQVTGTYTQLFGSLTVTILPSEVIALGAKWRRLGDMVWRNSGDTEANVPVGEHFVEFLEVPDWFTPILQQATVTVNSTAAVTGTYTEFSGSLTVQLYPESAVAEGAQWTVDGGGTWRNNGEAIVLPVGAYTVQFKQLPGWIAPFPKAEEIVPLGDHRADGFYLLESVEGEGEIELSLEADVAPRPDGDGALIVNDWVQVGRFVAGLDVAAVGSEFQRADCAPLDTSGDGQLLVNDWVQAGRYVAGLDAQQEQGGPTGPQP